MHKEYVRNVINNNLCSFYKDNLDQEVVCSGLLIIDSLSLMFSAKKTWSRLVLGLYCIEMSTKTYVNFTQQLTAAVILQISVVAAEQFGEGRADGSAMPIDNQLQHVLIHFHHHRCHLVIRHEEDDGEESNLELRTNSDEGATNRFHQTFPTELQVQDMVIFIRL